MSIRNFFAGKRWGKPNFRIQFTRILQTFTILVLLASALGANTAFAENGSASPSKVKDEVLVRFSPNATLSQRDALLRGNGASKKKDIPKLGITVLRVPAKAVDHVLTALQNSPVVELAEPNYLVTVQENIPDDPDFNQQWGLQAIGAPNAWDMETGGANVTIAIVDTGVDLDHPDLQGKIVAGWDIVNDDSDPQDDNGHGTHVAGIAAASTDNGTGIAGVSWGAQILPIKVLDASGSGSYADVAEGIIYAVDHGAKVINLSLGGTAPSTTLEDAVNYAYDHGVVVVAAAGNLGTAGVTYPARYANTIAVAAVDSNKNAASFSSQGIEVDLAAPGIDIYSTYLDDRFKSMSGTSMAAPFISGTTALLLSVGDLKTPAAVRAALENTALDLGGPGMDEVFGYGLVQIDKALNYSGTESAPFPTETPAPPGMTPTIIPPTLELTPTPYLGISIDFRDANFESKLSSEIYQELIDRPEGLLEGTQFVITSHNQYQEWVLFSIASLNGPESSLEAVGSGKSGGVLIAYSDPSLGWQVALAGTSRFTEFISLSPDDLVDPQAKLLLDPLYSPTSINAVDYKFPWTGSWEYWDGFHTPPLGLDIGISNNSSNKRVLSSAIGSIVNVCNTGTMSANVTIRHLDGVSLQYLHLNKSNLPPYVKLGVTVAQGTYLGDLRFGNIDNNGNYDGCGRAVQQPGNAHLHWAIPSSFAVDGWSIVDDNDDNWSKSGEDDIKPGHLPRDLIPSTNQERYASTLTGYVKDSSGAGIAGANVTFSGSMTTKSTTTNIDGFYGFVDVPFGIGTVTASKPNFTTNSSYVFIYIFENNSASNIVLYPIACSAEGAISSTECSTPTPPPTPPPGVIDGFRLVSISSPTVQRNQTFNVSVTYEIVSGSLLQSRGDHLHATPEDNSNAFGTWPVVGVNGSHYAGESYTFSFNLTAPDQTGNFSSHWRLRVGGNHIGPEAVINFTVQDQPPAPPGGIYVCTDTNKGGTCYGPLTTDYSSVDPINDQIESVWRSGCWQAVLYRDSEFSNDHLYTQGTDDLGSEWRNQTSSIRVSSCDNAAFTLYALGDLNGESWSSDRTIYDLGHWNHNDWAQSMRLNSGFGVVACEHDNFHGRCGRATGPREFRDITELSQGLRNGVSSIRVCDGACPPPPVQPGIIYPTIGGHAPSNQDTILYWSGDGWQYYAELWGGGISGTRQFGWSNDGQWNVGQLPVSAQPYQWRVRGWNGYGEGDWTSGSFYIKAPTVEALGVFTTDELGPASITSAREPQLDESQVNVSASKTEFNIGDPIQLYMGIRNDFTVDTLATLEWQVIDPAGREVGSLAWSGDQFISPGENWWYLDSVIPSDALTGDYTFTGSVTYNGVTTSFSTSFHVYGISSVVAGAVFTTDENGLTSAAGDGPRLDRDEIDASAYKTDFNVGDLIRLYIDTFNSLAVETTATIEWSVIDPAGRIASVLSYSGDLASPPGRSQWYLSSTIPTDALTGDYLFVGSVTYNGQTTAYSTTFHVAGVTSILAVDVFTTDENGTAGVTSSTSPRTQTGQVNASEYKTAFNAGDPIRLYLGTFSNIPDLAIATLVFQVTGPTGLVVPELSYEGDLSISTGEMLWYLPSTIPAEALSGEYKFNGVVIYDGQTTGLSTSFVVTGPQTVEVLSVFTTDENGSASITGETPQNTAGQTSATAIKTSFNYGEHIQLYIDTYNNVPPEATAYFEWVVTDPADEIVPELSWAGDLTTPIGWTWWYLSSTVPEDAITGDYTFTGSITYNGTTNSQSMSFHVVGPVDLSASPSLVIAGQDVEVSWNNLDLSGDDWISMHATAAPDSDYITRQAVSATAGSLVFPAPASPGDYDFRLVRNGTKVATSNTVSVQSCYTLSTSITPAGGGDVIADPSPNCGGDQYTANTVVQLTADPASGFQFNNWTGDLTGTDNLINVTMDGNKTVTAIFTLSVPGNVVLQSPTGALTSWNNSFSWTGMSGASYYILEVYDTASNEMLLRQWFALSTAGCDSDTSCAVSPETLALLANGSYKWRIQDYGSDGYGTWTPFLNFTLARESMVLQSPTGDLTSWNNSFSWTGMSGANYYILEVYDTSSNEMILRQWFALSTAGCDSDTSCAVSPETLALLANGSYKWRVQDYGDDGYGMWTPFLNFTLARESIVLHSPTGALTGWNNTFSWTGLSGASYYILEVYDENSGGMILRQWFALSTAGCDSDTSCAVSPETLALLANGSYKWRVQDYGSDYGYGMWTPFLSFTLTRPESMVLQSPSGDLTSWNNSFSWSGMSGANYYILEVYDTSSNAMILRQWFALSTAGCDSDTSCGVSPETLALLANGSYKWRVQDYGSAYGYGMWTPFLSFTLNTP